jgi:Icc-related predicted phosphoesterase
MRFLLVSDLHYALKQYDWTMAVAPDFDSVVVAGDHLDISNHVDGSVQVVVILKYLRRLMDCTRIIASSGNHDLDSRDANGEKVARWMTRVKQMGIPSDGDSVALGDTLVTVCPWWDGPNAKRGVEALLARDHLKPKKTWIWVYHAPPVGSPTSWDGKKFYGDAELGEWIGRYQPDIVFSGHIHQAPFIKDGSWTDRIGTTWVFNCGNQIGPVPAHIIVDTHAREAEWISLAGAQMVNLDKPLERPLQPLHRLPDWLKPKNPDRGPSPAQSADAAG